MSTMTTPRVPAPRVPSEVDVDTRFEVLARSVRPVPTGEVEFGAMFDFDYGQPVSAGEVPAPESTTPAPELEQPVLRLAQPARAALRLTRRGRAAVVVALLAAVLVTMAVFGGWATATLSGGTPEPVRIVEVQPGDTLYGIAGEVAEPGQIREMVLRIQRLNSLPTAQIEEGQKLAVPAG